MNQSTKMKDFSEIEKRKELYFKSKMIELIKEQECMRKDFKEKEEALRRKTIKENEKREALMKEKEKNQKSQNSINNPPSNLNNQIASNSNNQIPTNFTNSTDSTNNKNILHFSEPFCQKYLNRQAIEQINSHNKQNPIPPQIKKECKKRITQISFQAAQQNSILNELRKIFCPQLIPTICSTIIDQAKFQISTHEDSYELYSIILFNLFQGNAFFDTFLRITFFQKSIKKEIKTLQEKEVFRGLVLVYFGYILSMNRKEELIEFIEDVFNNKNDLSLIIIECILKIINKKSEFYDKNLLENLKQKYEKIKNNFNKEALKSRIEGFFKKLNF